MINTKIYRLESSDGISVQIGVIEHFKDAESLLFTWESSLMLAAYILNNRHQFVNTTVLEIGAGVGIPGLTCGHAAINTKRVVITERSEEQDTLQNLQQLITLNHMEGVCSARPLSWDQPDTWPQDSFDYVLGSDVLYSTEDFTPLLAFLSHVFTLNPRAVFLTTYKNRSSRRTLSPHLLMYGMRAEVIPLHTFLHSCHYETGVCLFRSTVEEISTTESHQLSCISPLAEERIKLNITNSENKEDVAEENNAYDDIKSSTSQIKCHTRKRNLIEVASDAYERPRDDHDLNNPSTTASIATWSCNVPGEYSLQTVSVFDETYMLKIQLI